VRRNRIVCAALAIGLSVLGCNLLSTAVPGPTGSPTVTSLPIPAPTTEPSPMPAQPSLAAKFIGLPYPPAPEGWLAGLGGISASVGDTSFSIQELEKADEQMLWFMKLTGRDSQGKASWVVLDVLIRSEIKDPGGLILYICQIGDKPDTEIVALGEGSTQVITTINRAWRANHVTGRFEPISTEGIVCVEEPAGP
jgi:hypothetical protein